MAEETKRTPVPGAVQAKMREGMRQRYALATTPSANPEKGESKR